MSTAAPTDRRLRIATEAYDLIEREVRPAVAAGARLWTKGSQGYPTRLRTMLTPLDAAHTVTFASTCSRSSTGCLSSAGSLPKSTPC